MCFYLPANEPLLVDTYFLLRYCLPRAFLSFAACIVIIIDYFPDGFSLCVVDAIGRLVCKRRAFLIQNTFTGGHISITRWT
jgi:hypothetical protein